MSQRFPETRTFVGSEVDGNQVLLRELLHVKQSIKVGAKVCGTNHAKSREAKEEVCEAGCLQYPTELTTVPATRWYLRNEYEKRQVRRCTLDGGGGNGWEREPARSAVLEERQKDTEV